MQANIAPVLQHYHDIMARDLQATEIQLDTFVGMQNEQRLLFGHRPLTYSLRPAFLTESSYNLVQDVVYILRQAILKIAAAHFNTQEAVEELGLTPEEIELASVPTNVIRLSATARMDAFMTRDSFRFVELNAESPAGIGYLHKLAKVYQQLPIFQEFTKKYPVRFVSPLEHLVSGLLRIYHEEFSGTSDKPSFAIVDFLDIPTIHEFHIIKEYLELLGYPCEISDPRQLELKDGWIYANGRKIDILYRRLLTNEFMEIRDACGAYEEGYRIQKTCYLNSFRTKIVHKKALFAFLTDPKYTDVLNNLELQAIRTHIPWTRRVRDRHTMYMGQYIKLLEFIRSNRTKFVIKPNDEYGGKGVVLGFAATESEWDDAINYAVNSDYVVQEVVDISREPFLMKNGADWQYMPTVIDLDPYINGPMMGGCLVRTSTSNLANVTAGGGSMPVFILRYVK